MSTLSLDQMNKKTDIFQRHFFFEKRTKKALFVFRYLLSPNESLIWFEDKFHYLKDLTKSKYKNIIL